MTSRLAAAGCLLVGFLAGAVASGPIARAADPVLDRPLVVVAAPDAPRWVRLLRASGAAVRVGPVDELLARGAGVVTGAAQLSGAQRSQIRDWVSGGRRLVTPNDDLLAEVGVRRGTERSVDAVTMDGLDGQAVWQAAQFVRPLEADGLSPVARAGGAVVAGTAPVGRGQVLALAVDPVADGRDGHELLPELGRLAVTFTGAPAGPARTGAEIYLDPGGLHNGVKGTPQELARRLAGVRAVHIAGWNADYQDPKFNYDYGALIDALHARGVLAYAWLEPPFVSERFWLEHPECREKTATGRDALVDWRRLIALEDATCFRLASPVYSRVVTAYLFDGVDVAELYFEPSRNPDTHTPFHPSALAQFGHDPASDPDGFRAFRTRTVTALNRQLLQFLNGLPGARQLDFKLTVIDNKLDPAFGVEVGSDVDALAEVARQNGAALQVEDPFTLWAQGPLRYDRLVAAIAPLMPAGFVYPALNAVEREAGFPTKTMTGAELDLAVASAAQAAGRVSVYSVGTVATADVAHLPGALGGAAAVFDTGEQSPWTVTVRAPGAAADRRLSVDGRPWPAGAGVAVVPAGSHRLEWSKGARAGPGLLRFTGELATASVTPSSMTIRYDSRAAAYAVVDRKPAGRKSVPDPDGGFSVRLAPGNHQVTISFASTSRFPWRLVVLAALAVVVLLSVMRRARRRTS